MFRLANDDLLVEVLDPVAEREHLGPRFCSGGFIWQVHDRALGPLLTGPEWPKPAPSPDNAQGLPESFRHSTTTGQPLLWSGETGLAPGAGVLGRNADGKVILAVPCQWDVVAAETQIAFVTEQAVAHWNYRLERSVVLADRMVRSRSRLVNRGRTSLVLEWFAHPFFALSAGRATATLPAGSSMLENSGYTVRGRELAFRRPFSGEFDGQIDHLVLPPGASLAAEVSHPRLKRVRFETDFSPCKCVVWANGNTFSLEPFLALELAPGEEREWDVRYEFGERG